VPGPEWKNSCYCFAVLRLWNSLDAHTTKNTTGRRVLGY